jgi:hypothetical protein
MAKRLIICAAEGRTQANRILSHLINGGFDEQSISILFADKKASGDTPGKKRRGISMIAKAGVAALLGGAFGVLSVPDVGSLIIAGAPMAAALGRLDHGGVARALEVTGLSPDQAGFYETRIKEGSILISINVADDREATAASHVVRAIGVQNITDTANDAERAGDG